MAPGLSPREGRCEAGASRFTLGRGGQPRSWVPLQRAEPTYELVDAIAGDSRGKLAPVIEADVIAVERGQLRFEHPLFAAAIRLMADPGEQRAIHSRLATVVSNPEEQARHRARSLTESDAAASAALANAAEHAPRRGAPDAADLFEEAVRLSPDSDERARLRVAAAAAYNDALDSERAASLLENLLPSLAAGPLRARALLQLLRSEQARVSDEIVDEALRDAGDDAHLRAEILSEAANLEQTKRGVAAAEVLARSQLGGVVTGGLSGSLAVLRGSTKRGHPKSHSSPEPPTARSSTSRPHRREPRRLRPARLHLVLRGAIA